MSDEVMQQKFSQLQMLESNLQGFMQQKQLVQQRLMEVESALEELKDTDDAYRIVGNIMVAAKKDDLEKDLKEQREEMNTRVSQLEEREKEMREKANSIQKEIMENMK